MANKLLNNLVNQSNQTTTTNGMGAYKSTLNANLDFFALAGAARTATEDKLRSLFEKAYCENKDLALKNLFHLRDIRGGKRERRAFRICFKHLCKLDKDVATKLLSLVPEYGRWDDVIDVLDVKNVSDAVVEVIGKQLANDITNNEEGKPISLLAKWMPSINTSSKKTVALGNKLCDELNYSKRDYRKLLVELRKKLAVLEVNMSANEWSKIDYNHVPSQAGVKYRTAFHKKDGTRYTAHVEAVKKNLEKPVELQDKKIKMNAATLFPHDIVKQYNAFGGYGHYGRASSIDQTLENAWKSLKDVVKTDKNIMVLPDVSGSMDSPNHLPISISVALAIYFAQRNRGDFKNTMISFESTPKFVKLTEGATLNTCIKDTLLDRYAGSTDLHAAVKLLVKACKGVEQKDVPAALLIISDMQFDCVDRSGETTAAQMINAEFNNIGLVAPQIVFWNVNGTNNVPVKMGQSGVCTVSGGSPDSFEAFIKYLETGECVTPEDLMKEALEIARYEAIHA